MRPCTDRPPVRSYLAESIDRSRIRKNRHAKLFSHLLFARFHFAIKFKTKKNQKQKIAKTRSNIQPSIHQYIYECRQRPGKINPSESCLPNSTSHASISNQIIIYSAFKNSVLQKGLHSPPFISIF